MTGSTGKADAAIPAASGLVPPLVCNDIDLDTVIAKANTYSSKYQCAKNINPNYPEDWIVVYDTIADYGIDGSTGIAWFPTPKYLLLFMESLEPFYY